MLFTRHPMIYFNCTKNIKNAFNIASIIVLLVISVSIYFKLARRDNDDVHHHRQQQNGHADENIDEQITPWPIKEDDVLNRMALEEGTDKGPKGHNYTRIYARYFAPLRNMHQIRFLELGIFKGNSVKMWERYFPNAELHFLDYSPQYIKYYSKRSKYHFINQMDKPKLKQFGEQFGPFDIIIDDAGHRTPETISAFEVLIHFVKPSGMYIIEDLHLLYLSEWGGTGNLTMPALAPADINHFLRDRIDDVNLLGATTMWASKFNLTQQALARMNPFSRKIESMHFYTGVCFLLMRDEFLR